MDSDEREEAAIASAAKTRTLHETSGDEPRGLAPDSSLADTNLRIAERVQQSLFHSSRGRERIGRFTVLEEIGRGGMGMVYAAYDEQLDRKVAVKVLGDRELSERPARLRFMREAQALARLSHPNVVTVHEVGESDGEVYLAMEFVRGQDLAAWIRTQPGWSQVLEVFIAAGRGLAAAHEAGLVHRDLKPHNIMRGEDGVVKVLDFGLARTASDELHETLEASELSSSSSVLGSALTRTGTVMGTPAYMSPEQLGGQNADARSDQFSFCVALYEALYGTRPFEGATLTQLRHSMEQANLTAPLARRGVPSWLHRVVLRGLRPEPDERWPSMAALLTALSRDPRRRRSRWLLGGASVGVLGLGALALLAWTQDRAQRCTGAVEQLRGVWDDARRAEVEAAILGIGRSYADDVWIRTQRELDAYADDWVAMHTEACEATTIRGEQSPQQLDLRMACLHRAAVELRTTVDTLASADAAVVHNAHELTAGLRSLSRCADLEALAAEVEPPLPGEAEAVEAARVQLARALSQERAGRYPAALEAVQTAQGTLTSVEYGPVRTEVALQEASVLDKLGQYEASEQALTRALQLASQWRQWEAMATAAHRLMYVVGHQRQQLEEGLRYWPLAEGLSRGDPSMEAHARNSHGKILEDQGKYAEAEAELRAALSLWRQALGPEHPLIAASHGDLGTVLQAQGKYEEANVEFRAALTLSEQLFGPAHPMVAAARNNLGAILDIQGKYAEAEAEHRIALALREESLGPEHPLVASSRNNLAIVLQAQGKLEEAEVEHRAVLALLSDALGPEHPKVASSHLNLGIVLNARGRAEEAEAEHRTAISLASKALGPQHPLVSIARSNLGALLNQRGKHEEAEAEHRAVLAMRLEVLGPEHPDVASSRNNLANALSMQGKHEEAEAEYRAALGLWEESLGPEDPSVLDARHNLANTLLERGKHEEAEAEHRAALLLREKVLGLEHPDVAASRSDLAQALLLLGRPADALPLAEQAWARRQGDDVSAHERAETAFVLARILWAIEGPTRDRPRARALAEEAVRLVRAAGEIEDAEDVQQWLSSHPLRAR